MPAVASESRSVTAKRTEVINWAPEMQLTSPNDTISVSTWSVGDGVTLDGESNTTTTATVRHTGGRVGAYAQLQNHIVTASGAEYDAVIIVEIKPY